MCGVCVCIGILTGAQLSSGIELVFIRPLGKAGSSIYFENYQSSKLFDDSVT